MQAIILKKNLFDESSEIVTLYARDQGKVRVVARSVKSSKSKLAHALESLFYSEVEVFPGRSKLPTITGVKPISTFKNLRSDLGKIYLALFASELVMKSTADEQPNPELFESFLGLLEHLDKSTLNAAGTGAIAASKEAHPCADIFAINLLAQTGYALTFEKCAVCGKALGELDQNTTAEGIYFSNRKGSFVCAVCSSKISDAQLIPAELFNFLKNSDSKTYEQLDQIGQIQLAAEQLQKQLHAFVDSFASHILERNLNASKYLGTLK